MKERFLQFIHDTLFDPEKSKASAKRATALFGMLTLCFIAIYSTIMYKDVPDSIIYSITAIVLGALGLTSFEKYDMNKNTIEIESTTTVEQTSTTK